MSHPAWVCGLKQTLMMAFICKAESHPAWVCGLKPQIGGIICKVVPRHTLRGCVD